MILSNDSFPQIIRSAIDLILPITHTHHGAASINLPKRASARARLRDRDNGRLHA